MNCRISLINYSNSFSSLIDISSTVDLEFVEPSCFSVTSSPALKLHQMHRKVSLSDFLTHVRPPPLRI